MFCSKIIKIILIKSHKIHNIENESKIYCLTNIHIMKKMFKGLLLVFISTVFSLGINAQGFVKGAIIQYKGKDGKMIKGKFVEFKHYDKILKTNDVVKIRSTQGQDVNVLFKDYIKIDGGKDVGNNTCNYTYTRSDGKSFTGGLNCYYFSVIIEDIDGFGQGKYSLRAIVPLTVVSGGSGVSSKGAVINCPHCGKPIKIDAHK